MAFPGGVLGTGEFDSFEITVSKQQIFQDARWTPVAAGLGSGNWNNGNNWDSDSAPGQIPNVNTVNVELGDGNATFGPATVYNNSAVTIRSLTFNSPNKYAVSGAGSITLEPYSSHATDPTATFINVNSGAHEIQLKMGLSSTASTTNNRINALPGTRLDINNSFDLNGKTMTIQGGGTVNFNNNIDLPTSGTILVSGGVLGGSGRINGTVTNGDASNPGTVSPGTSIGTLTIEGTGSGTAYSQAASGILKIELGGTGAGQFDVLNVIGGNASLRGKVDVSLADGYVPQINDTWEIIKVSGGILSTGFALDASDSPYYSLTVSSANHNVILKLIANPMTGVIGDYNGDNKVDAADYTVWRDHLGTSFVLTNRDPANSGNVSAADYTAWKSHFGQTSPGSGAGGVSLAVPEPATVLLLVLGTVMAGISSRRRL